MSTFERIDLAEFDALDGIEWYEDVDQYDDEGEISPPLPNGDVCEAREDGVLVAHVYSRRAAPIVVAAPRFLAALRAAYAEIDQLRASALVWNTVTDDPKSHPEPMEPVLLDVGLHLYDYGYLDDDAFDPPMWNAFGGIYPIEIGHRWACIPETKKS